MVVVLDALYFTIDKLRYCRLNLILKDTNDYTS